MNETFKKAGIVGVFLTLILCLFIQSIVDSSTIRRADTQIDSLVRELDDVRTELENSRREIADSRRTITECRESVSSIADGIGADTTELNDIIANLRKIRTEVEVMENAINFFYDNYGFGDDNNNNNGSELE